MQVLAVTDLQITQVIKNNLFLRKWKGTSVSFDTFQNIFYDILITNYNSLCKSILARQR